MISSRRKFLRLLGVTTATAPLAAKAAMEGEIVTQVGLSTGNGLMAGRGMLDHSNMGVPAAWDSVQYSKSLLGAADYIKVFGIPEIISEELRDQANYVHALDPDIACKRSWSMSVKILTQRQRNYERSVKRIESHSWQHKKREALKALLGFDWPS